MSLSRRWVDLSTLSWTLTGYRPEGWRANLSMELGLRIPADLPSIPMRVPGSIQNALRQAGHLPDWNVGFDSRSAEWVEHRQWVVETSLPEISSGENQRIVLHADGLDGMGSIYLNGKHAGDFENAFLPHQFDLTKLAAAGENKLRIVFTHHPNWLGQMGFTSQMPLTKARFNYGWDWTPRLVQLGVWDDLKLSIESGAKVESARIWSEYEPNRSIGTVLGEVIVQSGNDCHVVVTLRDGNQAIAQTHFPASTQASFRLNADQILPWWPNGMGEQRLYRLEIVLQGEGGSELDRIERTIGFRRIDWEPCEGAPAEADPWICVVNGRPVFLQGFNWVPIKPNFADVTREEYSERLRLYRDLGTNVLRVWGGAVLEKEIFYELCDQLGILVWQEFPLSSSGLENWPPEASDAIATMKQIGESYITRRQHHPSLLLWCGGNELQGAPDGGKQGIGKPVSNAHPLMSELAALVKALDPTRRFLPTSASGPTFMADEANFGKGLHHDVHGPWNHTGDLESWNKYWANDDALFRSEAGMPGAASAELIAQYAGEHALPADESNSYYLHTAGWWIQWKTFLEASSSPLSLRERAGVRADERRDALSQKDVDRPVAPHPNPLPKGEGTREELDRYVRWSQQRQAEYLAIAAHACKSRFPRCGGFIVWMGHDSFPCPINTSVIDFAGQLKPAAEALKKIFKSPHAD